LRRLGQTGPADALAAQLATGGLLRQADPARPDGLDPKQAEAYAALGLRDKARQLLQDVLPRFSANDGMWQTYARLLSADGHWKSLAALALQMRHHAELAASPARNARLLLLEHAPVYTLGRTTKPEHLTLPPEELARQTGAEVRPADRGGSVTYHGPGQLVAYLLLNLKAWDLPIHQHLWNLEEIAIRTLGSFGLSARRVRGMTGVWVPSLPLPRAGGRTDIPVCRTGKNAYPTPARPAHEANALAKIGAIGVGCRRWVTYHGLSLNVDLDLAPFKKIDPCGLGHRPVTSLVQALGRPVGIAAVREVLIAQAAKVLNATVKGPVSAR